MPANRRMVRAGTIITSTKQWKEESVCQKQLISFLSTKSYRTIDLCFLRDELSTKEGHITEDDLKYAERRACCSPSNYRGGIRKGAYIYLSMDLARLL